MTLRDQWRAALGRIGDDQQRDSAELINDGQRCHELTLDKGHPDSQPSAGKLVLEPGFDGIATQKEMRIRGATEQIIPLLAKWVDSIEDLNVDLSVCRSGHQLDLPRKVLRISSKRWR